ncbi:MAG: DUF952 domain-containing protein [Pseudomonadota bacterium]
MLIYKILKTPEWQALRRDGKSDGAPIDLADGFVHLSTAEQLSETLSLHFPGEEGLMLVAIDSERLGDALRWEPSRGNALFPHLYNVLNLSDVSWAQPLDMKDGVHILPPGIA